MSKKRDPFPEGDDGRTIAPMNLEGMPGYRPWKRSSADTGEGSIPGAGGGGPAYGAEELTREQLRTYRFAAVKAGLIVACIFGVVFFLFLAFCDFIWFR